MKNLLFACHTLNAREINISAEIELLREVATDPDYSMH